MPSNKLLTGEDDSPGSDKERHLRPLPSKGIPVEIRVDGVFPEAYRLGLQRADGRIRTLTTINSKKDKKFVFRVTPQPDETDALLEPRDSAKSSHITDFRVVPVRDITNHTSRKEGLGRHRCHLLH